MASLELCGQEIAEEVRITPLFGGCALSGAIHLLLSREQSQLLQPVVGLGFVGNAHTHTSSKDASGICCTLGVRSRCQRGSSRGIGVRSAVSFHSSARCSFSTTH